jgi:hypothetical protein
VGTLRTIHRNWRPDVERVVRHIERRFPSTRCNTYINHPWPGWDGRSIDVWRDAPWPTPVGLKTGHRVLSYVFNNEEFPALRHYIYLHQLWTSFGGRSLWTPDDHSGALRHLHLTFW